VFSACICKEISLQKEILVLAEQLGNLLSLCREIAGARDILPQLVGLMGAKIDINVNC
jgi:hypothetical protein